MKNTNPLFILGASLFILFIAVYSFNKTQDEYKIQNNKYIEYKQLAKQFSSLKSNYININKQSKILEKILKNSKINNINIQEQNKVIKVTIKNVSTNNLHKLINNILNKKLNIYKLKFDKDNISFEVGML